MHLIYKVCKLSSVHHVDKEYEIAKILKKYLQKNTIIICIGTDKCIGDSLGPFVGTFLKDKDYPFDVYGTIENPIHALNIRSTLHQIETSYPDNNIIAVDACLGDKKSIGEIHFRPHPIYPGKGVGKNLPKIGNASFIAIVESINNSENYISNNIRLDFIIKMARTIEKIFWLALDL
ncbi:MAG: spore protease YyaC [Oscillospiraceae bacterium]|nr:spore protease YyaC [Oscillospiraceae bacterium]